MEAKNTHDGRGTNRSYLEIGRTVDVQNTYSVIGIHDLLEDERFLKQLYEKFKAFAPSR